MTLSIAKIVSCQKLGSLVNNEFERIWKKALVVSFKVLSWYLPAGTDKNYKKPRSEVWLDRCFVHCESDLH
jgi:hypothetical protein